MRVIILSYALKGCPMQIEELIAVKVTLTAIPVFFLAIAIELIVVKFFAKSGSLNAKDDGVSIFMGLFSVITNGAAAFLTVGMLYWAQNYQITVLPLSFATLVACFVLDDLRYYCLLYTSDAADE